MCDLYEHLEYMRLTEYGSAFPAKLIQDFLNLTVPDVAPKKVYDSLALAELSAIQPVRNLLLKQGKYLKLEGNNYRILLPHENAAQILKYEDSAKRKLKRASTLAKTTPIQSQERDSTADRILMRELSISKSRVYGRATEQVAA